MILALALFTYAAGAGVTFFFAYDDDDLWVSAIFASLWPVIPFIFAAISIAGAASALEDKIRDRHGR